MPVNFAGRMVSVEAMTGTSAWANMDRNRNHDWTALNDSAVAAGSLATPQEMEGILL